MSQHKTTCCGEFLCLVLFFLFPFVIVGLWDSSIFTLFSAAISNLIFIIILTPHLCLKDGVRNWSKYGGWAASVSKAARIPWHISALWHP